MGETFKDLMTLAQGVSNIRYEGRIRSDKHTNPAPPALENVICILISFIVFPNEKDLHHGISYYIQVIR